MLLKFDEHDAQRAYDEWGCNCGPSALAAALGMTLDEVRPHMGPFEQRGYTNVSNMQAAILSAGGRISRMYSSWGPVGSGVARIQWGGPWIIDGKPARWAARASHWVAWFRTRESHLYIFDINGGIRIIDLWETEIVPLIIASIKRADGTWSLSNCWEIEKRVSVPISSLAHSQ